MIESCLRDLGRRIITTGVFKHVMMNATLKCATGMFKAQAEKLKREKEEEKSKLE